MATHLIELGRARCPKGKTKRKGYTKKGGVRVRATCVLGRKHSYRMGRKRK